MRNENMKKIDESVMESWLELRKVIRKDDDFSDMLFGQLKGYDITPTFILRFDDVIDVGRLSGFNLSAACIECLDELGKFDAAEWKKSAETKDLGILLNGELSEKYGLDANDLLGKARFVSDEVFDGLIGSVSKEIAAHMISVYRGDHCTLDMAIDHLDELGGAIASVRCVKQDLASEDSEFVDKVAQAGKALDPLVAIVIMHSSYEPAKCADLALKDADEGVLNSMDTATADKYRAMIDDIIQRYPTDASSNLMASLCTRASSIVTDRKLIRDWLIFCDGIAEQYLLTAMPIICQVGMRNELIAYAKNFGYSDLLVAMTLCN